MNKVIFYFSTGLVHGMNTRWSFCCHNKDVKLKKQWTYEEPNLFNLTLYVYSQTRGTNHMIKHWHIRVLEGHTC